MCARDGFTISTDPAHLDFDAIWRYLHDESYWANGGPRELVARSVAASLSFCLFEGEAGRGGTQKGFACVMSDFATFAWLCDVLVLPATAGGRARRSGSERPPRGHAASRSDRGARGGPRPRRPSGPPGGEWRRRW